MQEASLQVFVALSSLGVAVLPAAAGGTNLLFNGDFSAGLTEFSSNYVAATQDFTGYPGSPGYPGPYFTVANNQWPWNGVPGPSSPPYGFGDHTTGTGLMLIADGAANVVVWKETVAVDPNTGYGFSGYAAPWGHYSGGDTDPSPADLVVAVNGASIGGLQLQSMDGVWENLVGGWYSGSATSAVITIVDTNNAFSGNDFVLDDLSFGTPEPSTWTMMGLGFAALGFAAFQQRGSRVARTVC
jgi:PEP-CTERM motif